MFSREFWIDTLERAVKTFAQAAVAVIGANAVGVTDIDFAVVASVAGLAALLSVLSSIASSASSAGELGNASLAPDNTYVS